MYNTQKPQMIWEQFVLITSLKKSCVYMNLCISELSKYRHVLTTIITVNYLRRFVKRYQVNKASSRNYTAIYMSKNDKHVISRFNVLVLHTLFPC